MEPIWLLCLLVAGIAIINGDTRTTQIGTISYTSTTVTETANWQILPASPSAESIQIVFTNLNIQQAEFRIYDTSDVQKGAAFFVCVSCGNLLPPPILSKTGAVSVYIAGSPGVGFSPSSFTFQYLARPVTPTLSLSNTTVHMLMGYAKIRPQLFSGVLPAGYIQRWKISSQFNKPITFSFTSVNFGSTCAATLSIFSDLSESGNLIFTGCVDGSFPTQWLYSNTGRATVLLVGGTANAGINFELTYISDAELYPCSLLGTDILRDSSMILTDGTFSKNDMRRGESGCSWLIRPSNGTSVTLLMDWVQLKTGSSVVVYDNSAASGTILWQGDGPTRITPPPLISTKNNLYMTYSSSTALSTGFRGFRGAYQSNSALSLGLGSRYTVLTMSSVTDLVPPGNAGLTYTSGYNYTWYIQPTIRNSVLTFVLNSIDLRSGEALVLRNGPLLTSPVLATFAGSHAPTVWYRTSSANATLQFIGMGSQTPVAVSGYGFKLSYWGDGDNYHCGFSINPNLLTSPSAVFSDGSLSTNPLFTGQYCTWTVAPISSTGVVLFFTRFHIISGSVKIYGGAIAESNLLATIGDTIATPPPMILPHYSSISVEYFSGKNAIGYGFSATYYGISDHFFGPGDGIIRIFSASMLSLSVAGDLWPRRRTIASTSTHTWLIQPADSTGSLYFEFTSLALAPSETLSLYDGSSPSSTLLISFTGSTLPSTYQWFRTTSSVASLQLVSNNSTYRGDFELSYYSDGNSFHCGFNANPGIFTAPSMLFNDGSASTAKMNPNQYCEWLIRPEETVSGIGIEFLENDLLGAEMSIFDGPDSKSTLLWHCESCQVLPRNIISSSSSVFITMTTSSSFTLGSGFTAVYWTLHSDSWKYEKNGTLLELPVGIAMNSAVVNTTALWELGLSTSLSKLTFRPRLYVESKAMMSGYNDGRNGLTSTPYDSVVSSASVCGFFSGSQATYLSTSDVMQKPSQYSGSLLDPSTSGLTVKNIYTSWNTDLPATSNAYFSPSRVCKYHLDSGSTIAIDISLSKFVGQTKGRLRIYGGVYGTDALILDTTTNARSRTVRAPCGKALIILDDNSTISSSSVDYGFEISYSMSSTDTGTACIDYKNSLLPPVKKSNPWIYVFIAAGAFLFICLVVFIMLYIRRYHSDWTCQINYLAMPVYARMMSNYPTYTPQLDRFRNKFLPKGECCVCKETAQVFRLGCNHGICMDCIKGYLTSALGNIQLFPVKCPMHYEGCVGLIDANIAKRVLTKVQYDRYMEFSDRALYGEGMRCIFCSNYVNFPSNGGISMVECPYCIQRFCIRCKKPWHYGTKCPLDNVDDSLEAWKKESGAQRCPACLKLIEKDDPDTCNHMVHKITDGIPCVRDRTDFCYLCGEEVRPDYPHDEVRNLGVNHFPDGVFQKCRILLQREKDAAREALKKQKRMRHRKGSAASPDMDGWESELDGTGGGGVVPASGGPLPTLPTRDTTSIAFTPANGSGSNNNNGGTVVVPERYDPEAAESLLEVAMSQASSGPAVPLWQTQTSDVEVNVSSPSTIHGSPQRSRTQSTRSNGESPNPSQRATRPSGGSRTRNGRRVAPAN